MLPSTCLLAALLLAACAASTGTPQVNTAAALPSPTARATITLTPLPPTPTPSPPTGTPAAAVPRLCTPLQDMPFDQLPELVSNPYHPPRPGSDDPHQGVDLAVRLPGSQMALQGHPVLAALAGQVAGVVRDRFPYGNAILIETPLDDLPPDWWTAADLPAPAPTLIPTFALTCPPGLDLVPPEGGGRSLYVLYAHLQDPPNGSMDDSIACGQVIGTVGSSGNALNPHLHFETRVGPSGMRLGSLAHYDASATPEEMSRYCQWRVSGLFQLVDPLKVLALRP